MKANIFTTMKIIFCLILISFGDTVLINQKDNANKKIHNQIFNQQNLKMPTNIVTIQQEIQEQPIEQIHINKNSPDTEQISPSNHSVHKIQTQQKKQKVYLSQKMSETINQKINNKNSVVFTKNPSLISALNQHSNSKVSEYVKKVVDDNRKMISQHNANSGKSYKLVENRFIVYTSDQFKQMFLTLQTPDQNYVKNQPKDIQVIPPQNQLSNKRVLQDVVVDWKALQKVPSVKYQKECGACYAFAALSVLQSAYILKGKFLNLAQQEIIDCSQPYGNLGCVGGWTTNVYSYIKDFGVVYQSDYPYAAQTKQCSVNDTKQKYWIKNFVELKNDCNVVIQALKNQPLSIAINADGWQYYGKGIFTDCRLGASNHGVVLAGVDSTNWLIKNSWGYSWGQDGYIRISRTAQNKACNVCQWASYPIL